MKCKTLYIVLACMPVVLGGCGIYGKYERKPLEFDAECYAKGDTSMAPLSAMPWRELFTDGCLSDWIERGLKANTDLRIAQFRVEEASATLTASRLAFLPSLNASADGSVSNSSSNRFQIGPSASWELDVFGKQRNLKKGAEASYNASQAYKQAVTTSLIATIANGYYTLVMLDEQLSISERTLKTWDENIRTLQAFKRAGRSNEAAVLQARANRMKVESSTLTLRKRISEQENSIRSLLLEPDADLARGEYSKQSFPDTLSAGVSLELLSNRPDVRQAEFELQKAFYNVNVSRSAFYPSITLSGNAGWVSSSGAVANPSSWIANALGSITAPLFNRGTNQANLKISKAEYEIAALEFQQKILDAGIEVNDALSAWQTARNKLVIDKKQIVALRGAVHNTRLLMRNTPTSYLEVLTAQQRLLEAELTEVEDRYDVIQSVIRLYRALGGGVE